MLKCIKITLIRQVEQGGKMKKWSLWMVYVLLFSAFVCLLGGAAWAAQSTADAVIDSTAKENILKKILAAPQTSVDKQAYTIGYGDILSVNVYGEGDMAVTGGGDTAVVGGAAGTGEGGDQLRRRSDGAEVRMDGRVSLRHIGDVQAVGLTTTQLADYLKQLYSSIFSDPILTVTLLQSNSRRYTVMGKVVNPGIFYLDFPVTIVQAVARSGGFTEWANHDISVIRQGGGPVDSQDVQQGERVITFDYDAFLKGRDLDKNVSIVANDVVIVH